ncbi:hypothetical protein NQZ68_007269, partial [Dissostichus eleginoides]
MYREGVNMYREGVNMYREGVNMYREGVNMYREGPLKGRCLTIGVRSGIPSEEVQITGEKKNAQREEPDDGVDMPGANQGSTAGKPGGKFEELKEMMKSFLQYETARFKREERRLSNMEQPFSRRQEQVSLIKEKDDSKGSTGTNSAAEAAQILAENRRLMREQKKKEEQLRLQREEEEKLRKEEEMRLAEEARLIRLQEEKKLAEEKIKDEEDALLAEEERVKMVEKVRQERERVMQQNQQERRERKNQIPKRKKGKLPSDFTSPPEETMLHKGKQKHRAEWRHMEESKMAKINKCRRNEVLFSFRRGRRKCDE